MEVPIRSNLATQESPNFPMVPESAARSLPSSFFTRAVEQSIQSNVLDFGCVWPVPSLNTRRYLIPFFSGAHDFSLLFAVSPGSCSERVLARRRLGKCTETRQHSDPGRRKELCATAAARSERWGRGWGRGRFGRKRGVRRAPPKRGGHAGGVRRPRPHQQGVRTSSGMCSVMCSIVMFNEKNQLIERCCTSGASSNVAAASLDCVGMPHASTER